MYLKKNLNELLNIDKISIYKINLSIKQLYLDG